MLPVVARPGNGLPAWTIVAVAVVLGITLFLVLDSRRRALTTPAVRPRTVDAISGATALPAPLFIPPDPSVPPPPPPAVPVIASALPPAPAVVRPASPPAIVYTPPPRYEAAPAPVKAPSRIAAEPALVIDMTAPAAANAQSTAGAAASDDTAAQPKVAGARSGAGVLANRATTVPQGTLIPAVLETALDSTRPGLARAIVSRDIRGFDGSRVLIPRGSRLVGEYSAQIESGQKRMLVNWLRLIRPDGATIAIGSPGSDTLGRAGVSARVNSHFFERFAGAILQSALDVGVNLASRSSNSPVILALPGSLQGVAPRENTSGQIRPTLSVRAATSISVFVARDLDFTSVEAR